MRNEPKAHDEAVDGHTPLVLTTFDWVPEMPRGWVRDLRIRWALEEARLPYRVESTPFRAKTPEHYAHQPFGQVPWLQDGDLSIFESGAILLHLGERSPALLPTDRQRRSEAIQWLFAALNSVEMASLPLMILKFSGDSGDTPAWKRFEEFLKGRVKGLEPILAQREWLAGSFSIADILMADVLRLIDSSGRLLDAPACREYVRRAISRPSFAKAHADQLAHFAAADPS